MSAWLFVLPLLAVGWLCVFALCRAAGRASRMEERILHRRHPRVHEIDNLDLLRAMRRAKEDGSEAT